MKIKQFISLDLPTISCKEKLEVYRSQFIQGNSLIVLDPGGIPLGIVSPLDYLQSPDAIAEAIDLRKNAVQVSCKIREALMLMVQAHVNTLCVFDDANFLGVITNKELLNYVLNENSGYKLLLKNALRTLRKPIANILGIISLLKEDVSPTEMEEVVYMSSRSCKEAFSILKELESLNKPQTDLSRINSNLDEIYYK